MLYSFFPSVSKLTVTFAILCFFSSVNIYSQHLTNKKLTTDQWQEDVEALHEFIEKVHPNPYFRFSKEAFKAYKDELKAGMENATDDQNILSIMKLVAKIEDGHSHVPFNQPGMNISMLPLKMFKFDDGLYITDAFDEKLEGLKVLNIGVKTAEELFYDFLSIIPSDNQYHVKNGYVIWGLLPEILHAMGAIQTVDSVRMTVQNQQGEISNINLSSIPFSKWAPWWMSLDNEEGLPLYRSNWDQFYWHKKLEEGRTLYMKFNQVLSREDTNLTTYSRDLGRMIEADEKIERMVIDLRENPGGNKFRMRPLVQMLKSSEKLNKPGNIFLVTGRRTNSAATSFVTEMKLNTHAITIGEPIGGCPNYYSDVRNIDLPNSGLRVSISTQLQQDSFYGDNRRSHFPDISIPITSKEYFENRDLVLEYLQGYSFEEDWSDEPLDNELELLGKYKLGPVSVLMAGRTAKYLKIFSTGVVEKTLRLNADKNRYETSDGAFYAKVSDDHSRIHLFGYGIDKVLEKLPDTYMTPIEKIENGRIETGISEIRTLHKNNTADAMLAEGQLNSIGYSFLREGEIEKSIEVFLLNTELFPKSANVFDSLAEAYLEADDKENAIKYYSKSLVINPGNDAAKEKLNKLKNQN